MELTERLYKSDESTVSPLWLDHWRYTGSLLLKGGPIPWFDATAFDSFFRKADQLLGADVVVLPVLALLSEHVRSAPEIRSQMGAKKRLAYPAKTVLRDESLRARARRCVELASKAAPAKPLVLSVPSPRELASWAFDVAHGNPPDEVSADLADTVAVYLADFLSSLSDCALAAVMAEDASVSSDELADFLPAYASIRNVCSHQRWQVGLRAEEVPATFDGFDFVVSKAAAGPSFERHVGIWLPQQFWSGDAEPAQRPHDFLYGQIPHDMNPEYVLKRRNGLRAT